jgi:hypothetical protein
LWCSSSSSFLLNGESDIRILHYRGVRQRDPLSPMLFILVMETLHRMSSKAQSMGILGNLNLGSDAFRMSIYADDVAIFIKPTEYDLKKHQ